MRSLSQYKNELSNILWNVYDTWHALTSFVYIPTSRLLLIDDTFPNIRSPFRIVEFNTYLQEFAGAEMFSTVPQYRLRKTIYMRHYPKFGKRIFAFKPWSRLHSKLAYIVFLSNTYMMLPYLEKLQIPFVFELYPGGEFQLNDTKSDSRLRRIFASQQFRHVIVTQGVTYNYLRTNKFCPEEKMTLIYGGVLPLEHLTQLLPTRKEYGQSKKNLDICFVANKYLPQGEDKGYDVFIATAEVLAKSTDAVRFHVIGNFTEDVLDISSFCDKIRFYGTKDSDFFPGFYANMDIILSPNKNNALALGAFDGFPTGACIEASACGVALFISDPLQLNMYYRDGESYCLIRPNPSEIAKRILFYLERPKELHALASEGAKTTRRVFSESAQMSPRLAVLRDAFGREGEGS